MFSSGNAPSRTAPKQNDAGQQSADRRVARMQRQ
jgi:hypothetical protein